MEGIVFLRPSHPLEIPILKASNTFLRNHWSSHFLVFETPYSPKNFQSFRGGSMKKWKLECMKYGVRPPSMGVWRFSGTTQYSAQYYVKQGQRMGLYWILKGRFLIFLQSYEKIPASLPVILSDNRM